MDLVSYLHNDSDSFCLGHQPYSETLTFKYRESTADGCLL